MYTDIKISRKLRKAILDVIFNSVDYLIITSETEKEVKEEIISFLGAKYGIEFIDTKLKVTN